MKSTASVMSIDRTAQAIGILRDSEAQKHMDAVRGRISERAYQLYEQGGYRHGNDTAQWLQAEAEVIGPAIRIGENGTWFNFALGLPHAAVADIAVCALNDRALVLVDESRSAQPEAGKTRTEHRDLYLAKFPTEVQPQTAVARLVNGILTMEVRKNLPA